jgi:hypothetical protein
LWMGGGVGLVRGGGGGGGGATWNGKVQATSKRSENLLESSDPNAILSPIPS